MSLSARKEDLECSTCLFGLESGDSVRQRDPCRNTPSCVNGSLVIAAR